MSNKLDQYADIYELTTAEMRTEELIEIISERELTLKDIWSLADLIAGSLEYDHGVGNYEQQD